MVIFPENTMTKDVDTNMSFLFHIAASDLSRVPLFWRWDSRIAKTGPDAKAVVKTKKNADIHQNVCHYSGF